MSREIRFRYWCPEHKEMIISTGKINSVIEVLEHYCDDGALMQFTGLTDKNGKDIYEGDIFIHHDHLDPKPMCVIEWDKDEVCFQPSIGLMSESNEWFEVIGNIYENPELLEAK